MENKSLSIPVQPRTLIKKSVLKKLRKDNFVPGVVYGSKQKNLNLFLDIRDVEKYSKREFDNKIFTFQSEDKGLNGLKVIKKSISFHPTKRKPLHIDFLSLDMEAGLKVNVEVRFEGKPKGVKEEGGVFNVILRTVEIECLPADIPDFISVNVDELSLNENLHVSDLKIPSKLKLITKKTQTLCTVSEIKEEEVAEPGATPAEGVQEATATPAEGGEATPASSASSPTGEEGANKASPAKKPSDSSKK